MDSQSALVGELERESLTFFSAAPAVSARETQGKGNFLFFFVGFETRFEVCCVVCVVLWWRVEAHNQQ